MRLLSLASLRLARFSARPCKLISPLHGISKSPRGRPASCFLAPAVLSPAEPTLVAAAARSRASSGRTRTQTRPAIVQREREGQRAGGGIAPTPRRRVEAAAQSQITLSSAHRYAKRAAAAAALGRRDPPVSQRPRQDPRDTAVVVGRRIPGRSGQNRKKKGPVFSPDLRATRRQTSRTRYLQAPVASSLRALRRRMCVSAGA